MNLQALQAIFFLLRAIIAALLLKACAKLGIVNTNIDLASNFITILLLAVLFGLFERFCPQFVQQVVTFAKSLVAWAPDDSSTSTKDASHALPPVLPGADYASAVKPTLPSDGGVPNGGNPPTTPSAG